MPPMNQRKRFSTKSALWRFPIRLPLWAQGKTALPRFPTSQGSSRMDCVPHVKFVEDINRFGRRITRKLLDTKAQGVWFVWCLEMVFWSYSIGEVVTKDFIATCDGFFVGVWFGEWSSTTAYCPRPFIYWLIGVWKHRDSLFLWQRTSLAVSLLYSNPYRSQNRGKPTPTPWCLSSCTFPFLLLPGECTSK